MKLSSIVFVAALALPFALTADTPNVYAIRGALLVTAAGAPIESGTIVMRRGVIEAVGASVTIPPDAEVMDGRGLTIYPGLIDLGNTRAADEPAPRMPENLTTTADVERWKRAQLLKPQARAADAVKVDDAELSRLAAAGITSVLALPAGEVIAGQSALVNVVAPPEQPQIGSIVEPRRGLIVIKTPVAYHVSFPERPRTGGNAYPQSLMGVIAFVRQAFLDAQHHGDVARAGQGGVGTDDPALDALQPAVDGKVPVAFAANEAREILRALKFARELKLQPIVTGAREADTVAADLKSQSVRVVYSLNYPQRPRALAPEADEPLQTLRARTGAVKVPGELARAGIPLAFESAGLSDPKDFVKNAAKAVKAGLAEDAAIRALTIDAAKIAGVGDRLGSLETGKIANLVVTDGNLFGEKTTVKRVFVDGRWLAIDAAPPAAGGRGRGRGQ
jgi:imidazolonepropionase-like amidohydrolase